MAVAANQIDLSKLPSSASMAGVVRLRSAFEIAVARMDERLKEADGNVVMDDSLGDFMEVAEELGRERDRLFPTYKFGDVIMQSAIDRR